MTEKVSRGKVKIGFEIQTKKLDFIPKVIW